VARRRRQYVGVAVTTAAALIVAALPAARAAAAPPSPGERTNQGAWVRSQGAAVTIGTGLVTWRWSTPAAHTTSIVDERTGRSEVGEGADFALTTAIGDTSSDSLRVLTARADETPGGLRLQVVLGGLGVVVTRTITAYGGVAGFRVETTVRATLPLVLAGARLAQLAVGPGRVATRHALRAGADWREPGWPGPQVTVGDPHAGTWRDTSTDPNGPGQWLSLSTGADRSVFAVAEANDFPSVRTAYSGTVATPLIDYRHDVVSLGPFEEQAHVENPGLPAGRMRLVEPGRVVVLPPVFVGLGAGDGDEAWQFHHYLVDHRRAPYAHDVTFNSNGTNTEGVSLGAKDGMNQATIEQVAPLARALGVDTFILDDGWQARSGDWAPDPARFPGDPNLAKVRATIAPMKLGLWMTPMHFHPNSAVFKAHPEWACLPLGDALALYNLAQPSTGSNAAGIAEWSSAALSHVERRIRNAVDNWGVRYFKFDFLAWLDCLGRGDLYDMHDAFVAMLDRLEASYPAVTFQIDETNDYRLFPYESVSRGPSWFQNGAPGPTNLLHNLWDLSPYVPTESLGQHFLGDRSYLTWPVSTLMAAALLSHLTFFTDLRSLPVAVRDAAVPWIDFYHRFNAALTDGVVYPLLADPLAGGWTALQSWDPVQARGALLVFRQDGAGDAVRVALRNVPPGRHFELRAAPSGDVVGHATSEELRDGLTVTLPAVRTAQVLVITAT
jgi:hypothetical protein